MRNPSVLDELVSDMTRTINRHAHEGATPSDIIAACELVKSAAIRQLQLIEAGEDGDGGDSG